MLRQTPESVFPASYDATISELLDHVEDEAMVRRAAWARYEAVARDLGAFPALALPEAAVPWKLALRLRGVHRLVAILRTRGYDAEACAHVWAALLPCGTGVSPSAGEVRRLLESCSDPGAALPPIRVVERFIPA